MDRRLANLLLLVLVVAQVATGVGGWVQAVGEARGLSDLHRVLGLALVLVVLAWKGRIAWRSLRRRVVRRGARWDRSVVPGALAALALLGSLALGLAWSLGLVTYTSAWGYSPLNLHVFLAFGVLPFLLLHLARRWERRQAAPELLTTRRAAVRLAGLSVASVLAWRAMETLVLPRRLTGSRPAGSFTGNAFPVTSWVLDPVQQIAPRAWSLEISGRVATVASLTYPDLLDGLPRRSLDVVLDCTSGWWTEQRWEGVPIGEVLDRRCGGCLPDARTVAVVSSTGHRYAFPLAEARQALLATHVGGEPLSAGHGFPVRLVIPERRGYQWVKWVARLEVA